MGLDSVLTACGAAAEVLLILLMLRRLRLLRTFPAFLMWVCWSFVNDIYFFSLSPFQNYHPPLGMYEIQISVDSILMFAVLVELAWSVLRPIRHSLPKYSWLAIVGLILDRGSAQFWSGLSRAWPVPALPHSGMESLLSPATDRRDPEGGGLPGDGRYEPTAFNRMAEP